MPEQSQSGPHDRSPEPIEDRFGRRIRVQDRCRIDGAAHVYLGPANLPDSEVIVQVFARREWRPGTGRQPRFTLVRDDAISLVILIGTPEPEMRRRAVAPPSQDLVESLPVDVSSASRSDSWTPSEPSIAFEWVR